MEVGMDMALAHFCHEEPPFDSEERRDLFSLIIAPHILFLLACLITLQETAALMRIENHIHPHDNILTTSFTHQYSGLSVCLLIPLIQKAEVWLIPCQEKARASNAPVKLVAPSVRLVAQPLGQGSQERAAGEIGLCELYPLLE